MPVEKTNRSMSKQSVTIQHQHRYAVSGVAWYYLPISACKKAAVKNISVNNETNKFKDCNIPDHEPHLLKVIWTTF